MNKTLKITTILLSLLLIMAFVTPFVLGAISVTSGTLHLEQERDKSVSGTITVNASGTSASGFSCAFVTPSDFTDDDGNQITIDSCTGSISANTVGTVEVTVNIDEDMYLGSYSGLVTLDDGADIDITNFTLEVDVVPKDVRDICEDGRRNPDDIRLSVNEPDENEKVEPLDDVEIDVKVYVDSDDMDVEFTAFLIDKYDDNVLAEVSDSMDIDENDDDRFELSLKIPADIEEESDDRYAIYVVACDDGNEDEYCNWEMRNIDVQKKNDYVVATDVITEDDLMCGQSNDLTVRIVNAGTKKQEDVKVTFSLLDFSETKTIEGYLKEAKKEDVLFSINIPKGTESGKYDAEVIVLYDNNKQYTKYFPVNIACTSAQPTATLMLSQTSFTARTGTTISTTAIITNTGNTAQEFTLKVTPTGTWTDSYIREVSVLSGQSKQETITLLVK
ncbi:MAG: putative S-layer protein, partial [Nanoarchaeota archaeon]|nr:putative S-layer protein [Nanoarchaeota archaeon]